MSTWRAAAVPRLRIVGRARRVANAGSPLAASFHEEAIRAVHWRNRAGRSQWPVCGT